MLWTKELPHQVKHPQASLVNRFIRNFPKSDVIDFEEGRGLTPETLKPTAQNLVQNLNPDLKRSTDERARVAGCQRLRADKGFSYWAFRAGTLVVGYAWLAPVH